VAFPEIVFEMSPDAAPLRYVPPAPGRTSEIEIPGTWTIHGVSRPDRVKATLSAVGTSPLTIRVEGEHTLSLENFGVIVKPFLIVTVGDQVHVKFRFSVTP
jgi:polyisoprenoid-binding protein YceI